MEDRFSNQARESSKEIRRLHQEAKNITNANLNAVNRMATAGMAIGSAAAYGIGEAVLQGAKFIDTMTFVKAIAKDTGTDFSLLSQRAKTLGKDTMFTSQDIGSAMQYMAMAGQGTTEIFNNITEHYGFRTSHNELIALATYISEFSKNTYLTNNWINENYDEVKNLKKYLKLEFHREYEIGQDVSHYLKNNMNQDIDDFVECIICICMIKYFVHSGEDLTIAIIIAHGYSTASSIAEASNRMLNSYIFDAIDMPLDVDVQAITRKINDYIAYVGNISKLYLLVDMGSLEEIYQGLDTSNADIALVNNINTKCALEIGQGIKLNKTVTEVIDSILKENIYKTHVELKKKKEPIVICSCASGLGAAHKIKEILFNSLPEDSNLKIITYDYPALIRKQVYDQLMNDYEVICVIGTLDPNIESMKYIGIQELIINEGQNAIEIYFGKYMKKEQMEIFEKNILRNFTLSNVMNNLTILNPDKLLEHVAKAIDHLQNILHKRFKNRTCFGLYVHICCLVERLVTRQAISNFTDQDFKEKHQEFIDQVNISMKEVKTYYNVEIPDEEVEYIYNYIIND